MFRYRVNVFFQLIVVIGLLAFSCQPGKEKKSDSTPSVKPVEKLFTLISPKRNQQWNQNGVTEIIWKSKTNTNPDSVTIQLDENVVSVISPDTNQVAFKLKRQKTGSRSLRVTFFNDSSKENHIVPIRIFADTEPAQLHFKILNTYKHDKNAYTQGLFFYEGYLYESTGQRRGESSLRKVNPVTGEVENIFHLKDQFFGEGIAKIGDHVFMLTYTSQMGFIFDINTFEIIREFPLQTMQGWGLSTTPDDKLILSDGSSKLYFYEPEEFIQLSSLDVCNTKRPVTQLNELEYTPQGIFANVYTSHEIVRIDSETGAITGVLNLKSLYPKNVTFDYDHVLNGIAWDEQTNTFFVTGKYWPILYQIQITE